MFYNNDVTLGASLFSAQLTTTGEHKVLTRPAGFTHTGDDAEVVRFGRVFTPEVALSVFGAGTQVDHHIDRG